MKTSIINGSEVSRLSVAIHFNSVEDLNSVSEISVVRLVNLVSFNR
ncbi:hypothetical protein [Enterobacter kobei]|nr:hypothetical protein [Enterobacter kobei]MCK7017781.1 hypothetical protein [Enterobacter kobei]MCK7037383.1 hypothetical protein [Enterobacter kobei]MCM7141776.1 hypothetical protein [Enterobacter kobei]HDC4485995.1 hypothetical protein [Enterobacter kobei]